MGSEFVANFHRSLFLHSMDSVLLTAPDGRILAANPAACVAVLFLDLDEFKEVNDTMGHDAGDQLLIEVADRLVAAIREEDMVARLGGDEFVVALWSLHGARDAGNVADKIIASMSRPFSIKEHPVHITFSIGVSIFPDHGKDAESLLRNSDLAMYEAKRAGKNTYRFLGPANWP